ncbi:MAG: hypothetical protein ACE5G0_19925 [Rhodothermales bacterium]
MKTSVQLLVGLALLLVFFWVLSTVTGLLFWGGVAFVIGAVALALLRGFFNKRRTTGKPARLSQRRAEKNAAQTVKSLKREMERTRARERT